MYPPLDSLSTPHGSPSAGRETEAMAKIHGLHASGAERNGRDVVQKSDGFNQQTHGKKHRQIRLN